MKRPANHPTIWLVPSHLRLGQSSSVALGIATAVVFFVAAIAVLPREFGFGSGLVYGLALCSPSVMLGVERGNVDLLIFALIVMAVVLLRKRGRAAVASPLGTIREIQRVIPQTAAYSHGIKPFGAWAADVSATYRVHLSGPAWDWLLFGATIMVAAAMQSRVHDRLFPDLDSGSHLRDLDFFVVGALIFVTTFSLFESFEYRLVFLLLTVPLLLRWTQAGRVLGFAGLLLVLLTLWLGAPWFGVPVVHTLIDRWQWLTSRRPLFGADEPLTAAAGAQVMLAFVLVVLLFAAAVPRLVRRKNTAAFSEETRLPESGPATV